MSSPESSSSSSSPPSPRRCFPYRFRPRSHPSAFASYRRALDAISARTGAPLPSLIVSFGVLHEVTALLPLVGIFFAARGLGVGEHVVNQFIRRDDPEAGPPSGWMAVRFQEWLDEGEEWAGRVGRRYGLFGFEKGVPADQGNTPRISDKLAGDVANAVLAYGITKAILPLRIGLSLYLSPAFSRGVLDPVGRGLARYFRGRKA